MSTGAHTDGYDGVTYFLYTENMVLHHSLKFYPNLPSIEKLDFDFRQYAGVWLSKQGIGLEPNQPIPEFEPPTAVLLPAIGIPFYTLAQTLNLPPIPFVTFFVQSLIISGTSLFIFLFSSRMYESEKIGFVTALVFSVTSFIWPYNSSFFNQPLAGLLLISSLYFLYRGNSRGNYSVGFSGFLLGLIPLSTPGYLFLIPLVLSYGIYGFRKNKVKIVWLIVFLILALSISASVNYIRFGSVFDFGYGEDESLSDFFVLHNGWVGLVGLLFSPGKGLLFYYPLAVLFPVSTYFLYKRKMSLGILFILIFVINYIFYGTFSDLSRWTGNAWAPRYLLIVLPIISVSLGALFLRRSKIVSILFTFLSTVGFIVELGGKLIWYMYGLSYVWEAEELWKIKDNGQILTWTFGDSPIVLSFKTLFSNYLPSLKIHHIVGDYHSLGLAPCSYDIYLYCKFGILPILLLFTVAIMIVYFIFRGMRKSTTTH